MTTDTDPIDLTDDRALKNDDRKTDVPVISIERTTDGAAGGFWLRACWR